MTTTLPKTVIRFTMVNKRTHATIGYRWIEKLSFADGGDYKVNKMFTTADRTKAARFSTAAAFKIATQFSQYPAVLELADGTLLEKDTADLQAEQKRRFDAARAIEADMARELAAALGPDAMKILTGKI